MRPAHGSQAGEKGHAGPDIGHNIASRPQKPRNCTLKWLTLNNCSGPKGAQSDFCGQKQRRSLSSHMGLVVGVAFCNPSLPDCTQWCRPSSPREGVVSRNHRKTTFTVSKREHNTIVPLPERCAVEVFGQTTEANHKCERRDSKPPDLSRQSPPSKKIAVLITASTKELS